MESNLNYRSMSIRLKSGRPITLNEGDRSVEAVGATEDPVEVFDWSMGVVHEVLLMSGIEMPNNRQIPLLDSHSRWSISSKPNIGRPSRKSSI